MNKKVFFSILSLLMLASLPTAAAQNGYKLTFKSPSMADGKYFIGQHFRDEFRVVDSATATDGKVLFENGEFLTIDIEKTIFEAEQATENILREL